MNAPWTTISKVVEKGSSRIELFPDKRHKRKEKDRKHNIDKYDEVAGIAVDCLSGMVQEERGVEAHVLIQPPQVA